MRMDRQAQRDRSAGLHVFHSSRGRTGMEKQCPPHQRFAAGGPTQIEDVAVFSCLVWTGHSRGQWNRGRIFLRGWPHAACRATR